MKKLTCYLGLHRWVQHVRKGQSWLACRDCGKYADHASAILGRRDL